MIKKRAFIFGFKSLSAVIHVTIPVSQAIQIFDDFLKFRRNVKIALR